MGASERGCRATPPSSTPSGNQGHESSWSSLELLSREAVFYTGPETLNRPAIERYQRRFFERYEYPKTEAMIVFDEIKPWLAARQQETGDPLRM